MRTNLIRFFMFLMITSIAIPAAIPTAAAPGSKSTAATYADASAQYAPTAMECSMLSKINAYRKSKGLKALKLSKSLGAAAKNHSNEMASYNYASHTLLNGVTWSQNITNFGYPTNTFRGENIAAGNSGAIATLDQWKNSPSHNATMLNSNYTVIGIGRAVNSSSDNRWYWTTTFGGTVDRTVSC